ncbi:MAG: sugar phosphate isomerase/epimerase [Thermoguttaceae bacterium]|nr:sugar phosphate isomerase/epimerase [Thermoguttaceae bacterium]MDW8077590.1 sugar phosphate isomerase/epimerase family protein [Thermoguttaceae bacterium]
MHHLSRRLFLGSTLGTCLASQIRLATAAGSAQRFRIGACDWSLGATCQSRALEVAREIGLDGVQVNFRTVEQGEDLRLPEVRERYQTKSAELGVAICSLAISGLNRVPLATNDRAEEWVRECIEVMPLMGQKVVLLAFFGEADLRGKPELQERVIERLRRLAPRAEKAGVILGVESTLDAEGHLRIVRAVDSPAVKVYYDMLNMLHQGYDPYEDMRKLGGELICEIHCKESGTILGKGRLDFRRIKGILDDFGWQGWLVLEGAVDPALGLVESYKRNADFLRQVFLRG